MKTDKLTNLARGKKSVKEIPFRTAKKDKINKNNEQVIGNEITDVNAERALKAKQRVDELLETVEIFPIKNDTNVQAEPKIELGNNNEWLEEEVTKLSQQNDELRLALADANAAYDRLNAMNNNAYGIESNMLIETYKQNILYIYNELQNNYLGRNSERVVWTTVNIIYLLKQLTSLFTFLEEHRRY